MRIFTLGRFLLIGIIVTGHGNFASGLASSIEVIAGKQDKFEAIDFLSVLQIQN